MSRENLIPCKECGQSLSRKAETCPHCGAPQMEKSAGEWRTVFKWVAIIMIIVTPMLFLGGNGPKPMKSNISGEKTPAMPLISKMKSIDDPVQQRNWVYQAEQRVKASLRDPSKAEFRGGFFHNAKLDGKEIPAACGYVNAPNAFGGMTGYQRYVFAGTVIMEEQVSDFENVWNKLCKQ